MNINQERSVAIEPIGDGDRLKLRVYTRIDDGWSLREIIEGPFVFVMQETIKAFDRQSKLRVHSRKNHKVPR